MKFPLQFRNLILAVGFLTVSAPVSAQGDGIKSQFTRGFEVGFKEGYCYNQYKPDCLTPLTPLAPLPNLNESAQSYQDGFNRGFQTGLDLRRLSAGSSSGFNSQAIPNYRFNDYVETRPINAYATVGLYLEAKLQGRRNWIQQRVNGIHDLNYSLLFDLDNDAYSRIQNLMSGMGNKLKGVSGDWADDRIFRQTLSIINFDGLENEIYAAYQNASAKIKKETSQSDFIDLLVTAYDSLDANPKLSLKLVQEAESMYRESSTFYYVNDVKSKAYENLENYQLAIEYNDIFISDKNITHKELQNAVYRKAVLLVSSKKFADALSQFNNPALNDVNDTMSLFISYHKAEIYYSQNDYQNSLVNTDRLLSSNIVGAIRKEDAVRAMQLKSASLRELGRYNEALDVINTAIAENNSTSNSSLYGTRGKIYYKMKNYTLAVNDFIRATIVDDKDGESFYYLALCYKNLNQKTKACDNLQKAIKNGSTEALDAYPNICK